MNVKKQVERLHSTADTKQLIFQPLFLSMMVFIPGLCSLSIFLCRRPKCSSASGCNSNYFPIKTGAVWGLFMASSERRAAGHHSFHCPRVAPPLMKLLTLFRELATFSPLAWYNVLWYWWALLGSRLTSMALGFCMAASVPSGTPWSMASLMAITAACTEERRGDGRGFYTGHAFHWCTTFIPSRHMRQSEKKDPF